MNVEDARNYLNIAKTFMVSIGGIRAHWRTNGSNEIQNGYHKVFKQYSKYFLEELAPRHIVKHGFENKALYF